MNIKQLRKLVMETVREERSKNSRPQRRTRTQRNALSESLYRAKLLIEGDEGSSTTFTNQSNFRDFDDDKIDELFKQIKSKDPEASIFKAMEFTSKDEQSGKEELVKPNVENIAAWLEDTGEDTVRERIKAVGAKIPEKGLPKADMPFLPGPSDADEKYSPDDVADALTPGGKYNVDFKESVRRGNLLESKVLNRWNKLAGLLNEVAPPEKNSFIGMDSDEAKEYMSSGAPKNDGAEADDDSATVKTGEAAKIKASDCIPTQSNILLPKALGMAAGKGPKQGVKGGNLGAYFSTKGHILDGHHRWAATMLNDPTAELGGFAAIDMDALGGGDMNKALKHLTAIGNAFGNRTKTS